MENNEDHLIIWEPPVLIPPEFRLYYDEAGKVLFYTCDKPEGNYIVIDAQTYAESRPDVRVVDGRIAQSSATTIARLYPSDSGTLCEREDLSVITDQDGQYWKLRINEL